MALAVLLILYNLREHMRAMSCHKLKYKFTSQDNYTDINLTNLHETYCFHTLEPFIKLEYL